jgi:D-cysteine desulfhydrase
MKLPERLNLANTPTPIRPLPRLSKSLGKNIWVWRDDLTGFVEGGNKIRKLEFILWDAMNSGADHLITCGGPQSNHARATVFLGRQLGLEVTVVIREPKEGLNRSQPVNANWLLNKMAGANLEYVPFQDYQDQGAVYDPFLEASADRLRYQGKKPYLVGEGGSVPLGCFGYLTAVEEMLASWQRFGPGTKAPSALFHALGSGGTQAGLHIGMNLNGLNPETLYAVNVCDTEAYFQKRVGALIDATIDRFQLSTQRQTLNIFDGHFGEGYGLASDEDLKFYMEMCRSEGLLLDPVYTGKAFQGMVREIKANPKRFGDHVLFLHSGGAFAQFGMAERYQNLLT